MSTIQPKRLSYTRRDLLSVHADVSRYMKEFIPEITDTNEANVGRLYLTIIEALIDNLNYSVDQIHIESALDTARQRKNKLKHAYLVGYHPSSASPSSVDLTFSMLSGVAGVGGESIPIYTRCQTVVSPILDFYTAESGLIEEGETETTVSAIQGERNLNSIISSAASGDPDQRYKLSVAQTPHSLIEVLVDGSVVTRVDDFSDSTEDRIDYVLSIDTDDYTYITFGDGEFGKAPPAGSQITVNFVQCSGSDGNVPANTIQRVIGSLASIVGVDNDEKASGGSNSESDASIKRNAPATRRAFERAVTIDDYVSLSNAVSGVYSSYAVHQEGSRTDVYIMPEGGGVASSYLLDLVQTELDLKKLEGATVVAHALSPANIIVSVNIITFGTSISKNTVKLKVTETISDALEYTEIKAGRGFTHSDLAGICENIDNGSLIDYADFTILSRVPRVTKSNDSAPDIQNRVIIGSDVGYDTYVITAVSSTTFVVSKNGTPEATLGTVATSYITSDSEITFTLGVTGDTLTIGDYWTIQTSKYADNISLESDEFMRLEYSSDLNISVYFPNEYDMKTKSGS